MMKRIGKGKDFPAIMLSLACSVFAAGAIAGEADVLKAEIERGADGRFMITATVLHADEGWDHYADRWEVLGPGGEVIATRKLAHPHVNEQPFTRSLSGVVLADEIEKVVIRAHDSRDGYGGKTLELSVPSRD